MDTKITKNEIITELEKIQKNLKLKEFIILSDAGMVFLGIKKNTKKIEIAVPKGKFQELKDTYLMQIDEYNKEILLISDNIYLSYQEWYPFNTQEILGYKVLEVSKILEIKRQFNLRKDKKDIGLLEMALAKEDKYLYEKKLYEEGYELIGGVDEVGRGPLVGPVVAACCILPKNYNLKGLNDSKKLSEKKRDELYPILIKDAICYGIGIVSAAEIDKINIYEASKLAMIKAINNMKIKPEYVLVDAMKLDIDIPTKGIIHGDYISASIAAASIIAKVERDKMMYELDEKYPMYGFKNHKGYPTKEHLEKLEQYGPLENYRFSYGPLKKYNERSEVNEKNI